MHLRTDHARTPSWNLRCCIISTPGNRSHESIFITIYAVPGLCDAVLEAELGDVEKLFRRNTKGVFLLKILSKLAGAKLIKVLSVKG